MKPREVEITLRVITDAPLGELLRIDCDDVRIMIGTLWQVEEVTPLVRVRVVEPWEGKET